MQTEQAFNVKLVDITRYTVGFLLGAVAMLSSFGFAVSYVPQYEWNAWTGKAVLLAALLGSVIGPFLFWRWWAVFPAVVTIGVDTLTVTRDDAGEPLTIAFADVRSYGTTSSRTWATLRFNLFDGTRKRIATDALLAKDSDFWEMVEAVKLAAARYNDRFPHHIAASVHHTVPHRREPAPMARERGFFEQRSSTVLFVLLTCAVGVSLLVNALRGQRVGPMLALSIGAWVCYLLPWLLSMDERRRDAGDNSE